MPALAGDYPVPVETVICEASPSPKLDSYMID